MTTKPTVEALDYYDSRTHSAADMEDIIATQNTGVITPGLVPMDPNDGSLLSLYPVAGIDTLGGSPPAGYSWMYDPSGDRRAVSTASIPRGLIASTTGSGISGVSLVLMAVAVGYMLLKKR